MPGYMVVFRGDLLLADAVGPELRDRDGRAGGQLAAARGGAGGLALGVWALKQAGMPTGHIARRTVAFFVVTSAANFVVLILVGLGVFVGVLCGPGVARR